MASGLSLPSRVRAARLRADLILLTVALIWGSTFVLQRVATAHVGSLLFTGVRFLVGAATLLVVLRSKLRELNRHELRGGAFAGVAVFLGTGLQQIGLESTTAGKAGFVTGLYVVLVPILLGVVWRQRVRWTVWAAAILGVVGLFLLSALGQLSLAPGDGWVLLGAVAWAWHVIIIGRFAPASDPVRLAFLQYLVCGVLGLALGLAIESRTLGGLVHVWWSVVGTGVFAIALAFTLQVVGQRDAPPADAAVLLSLESVFAALSGWVFLGEVLSVLQIVGCALMFSGMLLAQADAFRRSGV
jgi:drug/metabolite transporter (DMT)-like permease